MTSNCREMDRKHYMSSVLVLFMVLVKICSATDMNSDTKSVMVPNKLVRGLSTGMWFGPRLGRRLKRNLKFDQSAANKEQINSLMDLLQDSPWVVLAMNEGKRHTVNFTPRLGRESGEQSDQSGGSDRYMQDLDFTLSSGDLMAQRSPPFAPRLGRRIGASPIRYPAFL